MDIVTDAVLYLQQLPLSVMLVASVVVVSLSFLMAKMVFTSSNAKLPPVMNCGWPVVGGFLKFLKGPSKLMQEGYAAYGEVFTVPLAHRRFTFILSPQASSHFFKATDEELSQREIYSFNVPTFGPGVVYDVDNRVRAEQFKLLGEALKGKKLCSYVPAFVKESTDFIKNWGAAGVIDLKDSLNVLTTLTASRTLLGREVRENMFNEVADLLHTLDEGMVPISVFLPYLPIACHRARDRARKELGIIFQRVVAQRRASGVKEDDLLQVFIDGRYKTVYGGRALTDGEITGLLIGALFAGQHTSSVTSAWTGYYMIGNKDWCHRVVEEQRQVLRDFGEDITPEALSKMEVLHRCITEALRLQPPLILLLRTAQEAYSLTTSTGQQYVIPKGDIVATSPSFAHRLPQVFPEPDKYDPDRFSSARDEGNRVQFGFIGFGGGRHSCMGYNFAYMQIKTIWSVLLRNYDFELVDPIPEPNLEGMVVGPRDGRVKYTARKLEAAA